MAVYDFQCPICEDVQEVRAPMSTGPTAPFCFKRRNAGRIAELVAEGRDEGSITRAFHGPMRRLYGGVQKSIVALDMTGYIEKAYRGEEVPASMTTKQVRAIVDSQTKVSKRGRSNARAYKTLR